MKKDIVLLLVWFGVYFYLAFDAALFSLMIVFVHEFGHYVFARMGNLYVGYRLSLFPAIILSEKPKKWFYLTGFIPSLITLVFVPLLLPATILNYFLIFIVLALVSIGDFFALVMYDKYDWKESGFKKKEIEQE